MLFQNVSSEVPAPSTLDTGLPLQMDELVTWATARDPDLRPDDAAELSALVRRIHGSLTDAELDREPDVERQPRSTRTASPPLRRLRSLPGWSASRRAPPLAPISPPRPRTSHSRSNLALWGVEQLPRPAPRAGASTCSLGVRS